MKTFIWTGILIFVLTVRLFSQNTYCISGKINDGESHEALIGAIVQLEVNNTGVTTDNSGNYAIYLKPGKAVIKISFVGYRSLYDTLQVNRNIVKNYELLLQSTETNEVIITSQNLSTNVQNNSTSIIKLTSREIKKLPSLMGESDVLRIMQLSPGVQSANEGNSGFYVRGGNSDQNLVLLDNMMVYNPSHVLGFFSVFNSDIIKDAVLLKSGLTADLGGRMSSVVSVTTIDPENSKYSICGTLGVISSKISLSGPIIKNKIDFYLAGRRSYIDQTLKPLIRKFTNGSSSFYDNCKYYFYDLNGKIIYRINKAQKLSITYYSGRDQFSLDQIGLNYKNQMRWGNTLIASTYKGILNENWFLESTLGFTNYNFNFIASQLAVNIQLNSVAEDLNWKLKCYRIKNNSRIIFGYDYIYHHFIPNNLNANSHGLDLDFGPNKIMYAHEGALFFNHEYNISPKFSINYGMRYTMYLFVGPFTDYTSNEFGVKDTIVYQSGDIIKKYLNFEPRITIKYQFSENASVKSSYTRNIQYIHLASASTVTLPVDVWLPSTDHIKPQKSDQYTIGYYQNLYLNKYTTSIEIYYKKLYNQMELLYGFINNFQDKTFDESIVFGQGTSYGTEVLIRKNMGKLSGWISYTLSRTDRQFDEINNGKIYPAKYDRKHDLNIVATYEINKKWDVGCTFIYATGNAMTIPVDKYIFEGNVIAGYSEINSFRMPAYHRLDISINYTLKKTQNYKSIINFSIFNVYNRANPYFIYFDITGNVYDHNLSIVPKQVSLFPILPSLAWNVTFN